MGKQTDNAARMLAPREEMIDRILKSVEAHGLTVILPANNGHGVKRLSFPQTPPG